MASYLYTLAVAAVLIALVCAIVPESASRHAKLICSLCIMALLTAPIIHLADAIRQGAWEIPEAWQDTAQQEQDYGQFSDAMVIGQLQVLLEKEQALPPAQCRIWVEWSDEGGVREVTLVLSGKAIWRDPDPIKAYVEEILDCQCKVVLE